MKELLGTILVATPCPANWNEMSGDERVRFCSQCQKHVYNLSILTAEAAAALIREKEGRLCGQFYRRADGTILHAEDCSVGLAARQWRRVKHFAGAAVSLVLLLLGVQRAPAGEPSGKPSPGAGGEALEVVKGKICVDPPPTPSPTPKPTPTPKPK